MPQALHAAHRYVYVCVSRKWGVARWDAIAYGEIPYPPATTGSGATLSAYLHGSVVATDALRDSPGAV